MRSIEVLVRRYPWPAAACTAAVTGLVFFVVLGWEVGQVVAVAVIWFFWWGAGNSLRLPVGEEPSWLPPWRRWAVRRRWWFVGLVGVAAGAANAGLRLAFSQPLGQALVLAVLTSVLVVGGATIIGWQPR
jgi:hypothetical protein